MISALRFEWRRLVSLRATWILLGFSAAFASLFATLQVTLTEMQGALGKVPLDVILDNAHNPISVTFIAAVCAMSFGHEYRYGTIRLTLTSLPRRGIVFASKALMTVGFAVAAYLLNLAATYVVALLAGSQKVRFLSPMLRQQTSGDTDLGEWSSLLWQDWLRAAVYVVLFCLIAFSITAIVRNLALGIIIPLIASTIFEGLLIGFLESRMMWLNDVLPYANGNGFLQWTATGDAINQAGGGANPGMVDYATQNAITPIRSGFVFTAWAAMFMAAAYALFERRDA